MTHLPIESFCEILKRSGRSNTDKALAVLWYFDVGAQGCAWTSGQLTKILDEYHVGTPNQTALAEAIRKTKLANESKSGFSLKSGSRKVIRDWLPDLDGIQPSINHGLGYLPEPIWKNTRGYIEEICRELNGCFYNAYYNAAAVMQRRLLETLLIETYEHLGRETEIKDGGGNYFMLADLVDRACGEKGYKGINLGRDSKKALKDTRNIGNWSAHARRFLAHAGDLTALQAGMRVLEQELLHLGDLIKLKNI